MSHEDPGEPPLPRAYWDALRGDEPEPGEVERAYGRFVAASRPASPPRLMLARFLLGGFAAGWGVVYAATGDPWFGARERMAPREAPSSSAGVAPASPRPARRGARAEPSAVAVESSVPAVESSDAVDTAAPPPAAPEGPAASSARRDTGFVVPVPSGSAAGSRADPSWQRAAVALRGHDYPAAEAALTDLETRGSASDRDAASLALAEVLLAEGRSDAARTRLERLSAGAQTPLTRDKARALLASSSSSVNRSPGPAPGTH
ncbi:MAG TPA: hypothetical protein VMI54_21690 [Polyangiaceae bacterium]|nr:hypothetical protein [Polyangiaceae bacterium]